MRGPELHRWRETVDLCHNVAMFTVLSSMPFLIIPNSWFTYLTTSEHWNEAFIKLYISFLLLNSTGQLKVSNFTGEVLIAFVPMHITVCKPRVYIISDFIVQNLSLTRPFQNSSVCPFLNDLNNVALPASLLPSLLTLSTNILRLWCSYHHEKSRGHCQWTKLECPVLDNMGIIYCLPSTQSFTSYCFHWAIRLNYWHSPVGPIPNYPNHSLIKLLQSATMIKCRVTSIFCQLESKLGSCWTLHSHKEG